MNTVRVRCDPCWVLEDGTPSTGAPHLARCLNCYAVGGTDAILSRRIDELCLLLGRALVACDRAFERSKEDPTNEATRAAFLAGDADLLAIRKLALAEPEPESSDSVPGAVG